MNPSTIINPHTGLPAVEVKAERIHPQREQGRGSGRAHAGADEKATKLYVDVIDATLTALLDESTPEHIADKTFEHFLGFIEGWSEMMEVEPLLFLTRQQTARINTLPRRLRLAWMSEYKRGVRQWQRRGGAVEGNRPVLPEIP